MCLTFDNQYLVTGDTQGLIYIWNVSQEHAGGSQFGSPKAGSIGATNTLLHTMDLHKDKGAITNLLCIYRPLSLYGLTANMKGYEPHEVKPFNKVSAPLEGDGMQVVQLKLIDNPPPREQSMWDQIAENEELGYLIRSS